VGDALEPFDVATGEMTHPHQLHHVLRALKLSRRILRAGTEHDDQPELAAPHVGL
jgi:hypothetical protein